MILLVRLLRAGLFDEALNIVEIVLPQLALVTQELGHHVGHQGGQVRLVPVFPVIRIVQ